MRRLASGTPACRGDHDDHHHLRLQRAPRHAGPSRVRSGGAETSVRGRPLVACEQRVYGRLLQRVPRASLRAVPVEVGEEACGPDSSRSSRRIGVEAVAAPPSALVGGRRADASGDPRPLELGQLGRGRWMVETASPVRGSTSVLRADRLRRSRRTPRPRPADLPLALREFRFDRAEHKQAGGAGYIGSVIVHQLLDAGHTVEVIDDLLDRPRRLAAGRSDVAQAPTCTRSARC